MIMPTILLPVLFGIGSLVGVAAMTLQRSGPGPMAALFPPWWSAARSVLAAAGAGSILSAGALPFVVMIAPEDTGSYDRLREAGAWAILDPQRLTGCSSWTPRVAQ